MGIVARKSIQSPFYSQQKEMSLTVNRVHFVVARGLETVVAVVNNNGGVNKRASYPNKDNVGKEAPFRRFPINALCP